MYDLTFLVILVYANIFCGFLCYFDIYIIESADLESANCSSLKAKFGTADFLVQLEKRRSIKVCITH